MGTCRTILDAFRHSILFRPQDLRSENPAVGLKRHRHPGGDHEKVLFRKADNRDGFWIYAPGGVFLVRSSGGHIGIPDIEPKRSVGSQNPPDLTKDLDDMTDKEFRRRFVPETSGPSATFQAKNPVDVLLVVSIESAGRIAAIEPIRRSGFPGNFFLSNDVPTFPGAPVVVAGRKGLRIRMDGNRHFRQSRHRAIPDRLPDGRIDSVVPETEIWRRSHDAVDRFVRKIPETFQNIAWQDTDRAHPTSSPSASIFK